MNGAYYNKKDYDHAITDYNAALKLDPKFAYAYNNRSIAKRAKGDSAGADADIAEPRELDPKLGN